MTRVAFQGGNHVLIHSRGRHGTHLFTFNGAACYVTEGLAISTVSVMRVGDGPDCKDISHIEYLSAPLPPITGSLQVCVG